MLLLPRPREFETQLELLHNASKAVRMQAAEEQAKRFEHRYFACDFEATVEEPYTVYMVTIEAIDTGEQWLFSTIDEYLDFCIEHPNSTHYFHNGDKYDFEFIIARVYSDKKWQVSTGRYFKLDYPLPEFMLTKTGKIQMHKEQPVQARVNIRLRDSRNVVVGSIYSLGKSIGLKKGMGFVKTPLVAKINEDGTWVERVKQPNGYEIDVERTTNFTIACIQNKWWQYAMQDTHILAEVLKHYKVIKYADKQKYTKAGIAYAEMVDGCPAYQRHLKEQNRYAKQNPNYRADAIIMNKEAKQAYKGGIAWANPAYADKMLEVEHGYHLDFKSMYPSIYMQPELYPLPTREPAKRQTDLYIVHFKNLRATCKPGAFPILKLRTGVDEVNANYYLQKFIGDISITTPEYLYLFEFYENIEYDEIKVVYYEENVLLEQAMKAHGDKWFAQKEVGEAENNQPKRTFAKDMINTCYGYLGFFQKPVDIYKWCQLEDGTMNKEKVGTGYTGLDFAEVPAASFITAYGRVKLAREINAVGVQNVVCCDTDSLFIINLDWHTLLQKLDIGNGLGQLALEHRFTKITALKAKTYCISSDWTTPEHYAKYGYNPYRPIAQATAGSNWQFKDIRNFRQGEQFVSSEIERGIGGVGIKWRVKRLGEMEQNIREIWTNS